MTPGFFELADALDDCGVVSRNAACEFGKSGARDAVVSDGELAIDADG